MQDKLEIVGILNLTFIGSMNEHEFLNEPQIQTSILFSIWSIFGCEMSI